MMEAATSTASASIPRTTRKPKKKMTTMCISSMTKQLLLVVSLSMIYAFVVIDVVDAVPYMLLTSSRSKCLSVIAPQSQTITIDYDAPDLRLPEDDGEDEEIARKIEEEKKEAAASADAADGLDSQWNKRMKDRLEQMKMKKMRDVSITATQKTNWKSVVANRKRQVVDGDGSEDEASAGSGRVREDLYKRQGSILFKTGDSDGQVEICVASVMASIKNPVRVSIQVKMTASEEEEEPEEDKTKSGMENVEVQAKMSRLERDIQTLNNRVKAALNNADFNKEQEANFHQQSVNMNRAATYWPIIQLVILLVTGFTQANHIISYLRTHHIGI
mmetsp:Transcript_61525/g.150594  ORF Transcript_61525/g.150594 Transcript_61525/m.150594 type:complete len:331 (+) Transcript_61525:92-1084(+)